MRARVLVPITTLALAGALAWPHVATASSSTSSSHTLKVHEKFTGIAAQDGGKKGPSLGDHLAFASVVRDLKGTKLGIGAGDCVQFAGTTDINAKYHCTQSYNLGGDQLFVGGMFTFAHKVNKFAIMGGTGRYRSATGQVDFTTLTADSFADTFHFDS